jgi:hypothetical protein
MPQQNEREAVIGRSSSGRKGRDIAIEAYIYGYPLVLMDVTRQVMTNVSGPGEHAAPLNQFGHMRAFPDDTNTTVVEPNADTLGSFAFLDLSPEPMVLSVPDMDGRYYLMQMLDGWTNVFASLGTRTNENAEGDFAITGPGWTGKLPGRVQEIRCPTAMCWIIGRTQTNGKSDYAAVHDVQDRYKLTPLSSFGKPYKPPDDVPVTPRVDVKTPPVEQVTRMSASAFFGRLSGLMQNNPPAGADAGAVERFAAIGIAPGKPFRLESMHPSLAKEIEASVVDDAQARIIAEAGKPHGRNLNGWQFMTNMGRSGTDYLWRAVAAFMALDAGLPEDAIYPRATTDTDGHLLTGANRYEITFQKGQLPPVGAFWSITMYNDRQFFVPNPIGRYAIGDRDKIEFNNDGSLTLYVQNESPGKDKEPNWLPAPKDSFNLLMRLYWPKKEILNGAWKPPRIERSVAARKVASETTAHENFLHPREIRGLHS